MHEAGRETDGGMGCDNDEGSGLAAAADQGSSLAFLAGIQGETRIMRSPEVSVTDPTQSLRILHSHFTIVVSRRPEKGSKRQREQLSGWRLASE